MNVGIVLINYGLGGTEKRFPNLLRYLAKNGRHNYTLIVNRYLASRLKSIDHLRNLESITVEIPLKSNYLSKIVDAPTGPLGVQMPYRYAVKRLFRKKVFSLEGSQLFNQFDVVHVPLGFVPGMINIQKGLVLEAQCLHFNPDSKYYHASFQHLIAQPNHYINCASARIRKGLLDNFPSLREDRLLVNPCSFIDYRKTKIATKENIITFSARFIDDKNPHLFLEVAKKVIEQSPVDVQIHMLGKGVLEPELKARVQSWGLESKIKIYYTLNPVEILSRSLIHLSIQKSDNYHSQALMEAMACGCAIVATKIGETGELVRPNAGVLVSANADEIANQCLQMLANKEQTVQMGQAASEFVQREQTVERYASYLEDFYTHVGQQNHLNA